MTLLELKSAIAGYLGITVADLTVNGLDLGLLALNQVRLRAEMEHDFNFQRQLLSLSLNTLTGTSLDNAVIYGTATNVEIKQIYDIGSLDTSGRFNPTEWTSTSENSERQRQEQRWSIPISPTDGMVLSRETCGPTRLLVRNNKLFYYPQPETSSTVTIGIEAAIFTNDWVAASDSVVVASTDWDGSYLPFGSYDTHRLYIKTGASAHAIWWNSTKWVITPAGDIGNATPAVYYDFTPTAPTQSTGTAYTQDPTGTYVGHGTVDTGGTATLSQSDSTSDVWTTKGAQYLMWAAIVDLNNTYKFFVQRQEGNLPPPTALASAGLQALTDWDLYKYEGRRRHQR